MVVLTFTIGLPFFFLLSTQALMPEMRNSNMWFGQGMQAKNKRCGEAEALEDGTASSAAPSRSQRVVTLD